MQDFVEVNKAAIDFEKVGKRIQQIRKSKKITQADLASICGCSSNYLSAIETGVNKPSIEMITRISLALNKSVDYFLVDAPKNLVSKSKVEILKEAVKSSYKNAAGGQLRR